jgi:16S rRNA (guanine1516-N2)-methyltransferase
LFHHPAARDWVARWSGRFELIECLQPPALEGALLWAVDDHLELRFAGERGPGAWVTEAEVGRRVRQAPELLRACAVRPGDRVLDAMAGWGLDGLVLAGAGARVVMVEREPLLQVLQEDLIRRLDRYDVESSLGNGFLWLREESGYDVIYLDPMFPERNKRALPGKRLQYLGRLVGAAEQDRPLAEWIDRAIECAVQRVVVKRRLHDPALAEPDWQIRGRSIRYDVYRGRRGLSARA